MECTSLMCPSDGADPVTKKLGDTLIDLGTAAFSSSGYDQSVDVSVSFDVTRYNGYENFTADNFIVEPANLLVYVTYNGTYGGASDSNPRTSDSETIGLSKVYSDGILTVSQRTGHVGCKRSGDMGCTAYAMINEFHAYLILN